MIRIDETISRIEGSREPLSADVGVIRGRERLWFYDVGGSEAALREIRGLLCPGGTAGEKRLSCGIILSHFHPDHTGNLRALLGELRETGEPEIYAGANTLKYTGCGTAVREDLFLEDGCRLHLFPIPSSHAKGCLGLEVDEKYAFLGDAVYCARKDGKSVYNAQLLREEIRVLKALRASAFLVSHQEGAVKSREEVLGDLEKIYALRKKGFCMITPNI